MRFWDMRFCDIVAEAHVPEAHCRRSALSQKHMSQKRPVVESALYILLWPTVLPHKLNPNPKPITSTITRYVFERSTRSVDKRSSYLREFAWQPSWQLDNCPDRLNCASVYMVNCELCTASAQRPVPTAGHARPCTVVAWSTPQ